MIDVFRSRVCVWLMWRARLCACVRADVEPIIRVCNCVLSVLCMHACVICVCACVRACVCVAVCVVCASYVRRACASCVRACVRRLCVCARVCVRACVRACVRVRVSVGICDGEERGGGCDILRLRLYML